MGPSILGNLDVKPATEYRGCTRELIHTPLLAGSAQDSPRHPLARGRA
nr:hypothetical protein [uncultured Pseudomonas sp.]